MQKLIPRLIFITFLFVAYFGVGVLVSDEAARIPLNATDLSIAIGVYDFTWSPDGQSLVYVSSQSGSSELWIVSSEASAPKRITLTGLSKTEPRWSPNGQWIAYVVEREGGHGDVVRVSADGTDSMRLAATADDERDPRWSPDSQRLAFVRTERGLPRIAILDIEQGRVQLITEIPSWDPRWSPDGQWIAFVSNPLLPNDDRRDNRDVFVVPSAGGTPRLLTPGTQRYRDFAPSWAPDSRQLVYASEASGHSNLHVVDIESRQTRHLTDTSIVHLSPKWSPDGNAIGYVRNEDFRFHVWTIPAEGGRPVHLSERDGVNGGFEAEGVGPRGTFQWSPSGDRIAYTHSDPGRASDIWIANADGSRSYQVTNSMPPELRRESRFVRPDVFTYRSFDREEIAALVYTPPGRPPDEGLPALLVFRETLEGQNAFEWNPFVQFFVSRGYLVFAPNVRGSSGRGKDYRQSVFEHGGDYDVRDALVGLDRLSADGVIDPERVGVLGAGTGGFLAGAALIRDEMRFRAAACLYGIVDAVTAASYPEMRSWTRYMIGSTPIDSPFRYYQRSLINFVDRLRVPVTFVYAGNDRMAPIQQLHQFIVNAEVKGKSYDYRIFENEPHGWRRWRPTTLQLSLVAMDTLFAEHVLGKQGNARLSRNR